MTDLLEASPEAPPTLQERARELLELATAPVGVYSRRRPRERRLASAAAELARAVHYASLCSCEVVEDGGPESGPHLSITEFDAACPMHGAHTPEWREGEEQQRGYELSLLLGSIEGMARTASRVAADSPGEAWQAWEVRAEVYREVAELIRTTDAGRVLAEAEGSWEQRTESSNR